jgi:hypothetical protein
MHAGAYFILCLSAFDQKFKMFQNGFEKYMKTNSNKWKTHFISLPSLFLISAQDGFASLQGPLGLSFLRWPNRLPARELSNAFFDLGP